MGQCLNTLEKNMPTMRSLVRKSMCTMSTHTSDTAKKSSKFGAVRPFVALSAGPSKRCAMQCHFFVRSTACPFASRNGLPSLPSTLSTTFCRWSRVAKHFRQHGPGHLCSMRPCMQFVIFRSAVHSNGQPRFFCRLIIFSSGPAQSSLPTMSFFSSHAKIPIG